LESRRVTLHDERCGRPGARHPSLIPRLPGNGGTMQSPGAQDRTHHNNDTVQKAPRIPENRTGVTHCI